MAARLALVLSAGFLLVGCPSSTPPPSDAPDLAAPPVTGCDGGVEVCGCKNDIDCPVNTPRCDHNTQKCVACLVANDNCALGTHCVADNTGFSCTSTCQKPSDCAAPDGGSAPQCCSSACSDPASDPFNCGGCGRACPFVPNASPGCHAASCGIGSCNAGFADCDKMLADGCEINLLTDGKNCGACGTVCAAWANGTDVCVAGVCTTACNVGFYDCNKDPADGCEVNAQTDVKNCGACGSACPATANSTVACSAGACAIGMCNPGYRDCNKVVADGCEINVLTDVKNCTLCGASCNVPFGVPACTNGTCLVASCNAGYADCNNLEPDGCETNIAMDVKNCGTCGTVCRPPNGTPGCAAGACTITACNAGFADCNMKVADGCEDPIATDVMNCGGCGKACPMVVNGVAGCANAMCGVASCNFGYADCNKDPSDGCEADLHLTQNCGACGIVCMPPANASAGCNGGLCGIGKCNPLFGDCDLMAANGCEKPLAADVNNCGACGKVCVVANAAPACLNGICGYNACNAGYADCDKNAANGCEVNLNTDANNCGGCGVVCPNNAAVCGGGKCTSIDLSNLFSQYVSAGRTVYIWKTPVPCANLANYTNFCQVHGLNWFTPKSAPDAQALITNAFALDGFHTWIQVFGLKTGFGTIGGFPVTVDSGGCEETADGSAFGAFRKWGCSFCNPSSNMKDQNNNQSCCWDKGHTYDWFVCE